MTYRSRAALGLALAFILVLALALTLALGLSDRAAERRRRLDRFALDFTQNEVAGFELVGLVSVERTGMDAQGLPTWRLKISSNLGPVEAPADGLRVNALLNTLQGLEAERRLGNSSPDMLRDYGLSPPRARFVFRLSGPDSGRSQELSLGRRSGYDGLLYLQIGSEVVLVQSEVEADLLLQAFDLRDKHLLAFRPAEVLSLSLEGTARLAFERRERGFFLTVPAPGPAEPEAVQQFLTAIGGLQAMAFPEVDLPPPTLKLTLELEGGRRLGLAVARGADGVVYAKPSPAGSLAQIGPSDLEALERTPDLTARRLLRFAPDRVAKIKLSAADELIVVERRAESGTWVMVAPYAIDASRSRVEHLLQGLLDLRAQSCEPHRAPLGLVRTISLFGEAGEELSRLQIGRATSNGTQVIGSAIGELCYVETTALPVLKDSAAVLAE